MTAPDHTESELIYAQLKAVRKEQAEIVKPFEFRAQRLHDAYRAQFEKELLDAVESGYIEDRESIITDIMDSINRGYFSDTPECLGCSSILAPFMCAFCVFADGGDGVACWPGCSFHQGDVRKAHVCSCIRKAVSDDLIRYYIAVTKKAKGGYWSV